MNDDFKTACINGDFTAAIALYNSKEQKFTPETHGKTFINACEENHIQIAKWLSNHYDIEIDHLNIAFFVACRSGHLSMAQWLKTTWPQISDNNRNTFFNSCVGKSPDIPRWLYQSYPEYCTGVDFDNVFKSACCFGAYSTIRWLIETWPHINYKYQNHSPMRLLIQYNFSNENFLAMAKFLTKLYDRPSVDGLIIQIYHSTTNAELIHQVVSYIVYYHDVRQLDVGSDFQKHFDDVVVDITEQCRNKSSRKN